MGGNKGGSDGWAGGKTEDEKRASFWYDGRDSVRAQSIFTRLRPRRAAPGLLLLLLTKNASVR